MRNQLALACSLLLALTACADDPPAGPTLDGGTPREALMRPEARGERLSALLRVDLADGALTVTPLSKELGVSAGGLDVVSAGDGTARVLLDVALTNLGPQPFTTPTSPPPPTGYNGLMFRPGRTGVVAGVGRVAPSTDWDRPPFNFVDGSPCSRLNTTPCQRWEPYPEPLRPGATSRPRQVGFVVAGGVDAFEVELVLEADVSGGETGSVQAHVESADLGPLTGVTVSAGGRTGLTGSTGVALVTEVPAGPAGVSLSTLPAGCTNPGSVLTTVPAGGTAVVKFGVHCTRRIAFTSTRDDGTGEIYSMNPDGSGITRLTYSQGFDGDPSPSPNGHRIAFVSSRDPQLGSGVYVMNADGTGVTRLVYGLDPAWSQDGAAIAYTRIVFNWSIWTMNADGSGQTQRTFPGPQELDASPAIGPDGSIAFTRITPDPDADYNDYNIWVVSPSGTETQITSGPTQDHSPTWSPDGSRIAFVSGPNGGSSGNDGPGHIWVMNADGSSKVQLTSSTAGDFAPTWSPNGAKIAFTSNRDGQWEIYVMNADGSDETRLTINGAADSRPGWKP